MSAEVPVFLDDVLQHETHSLSSLSTTSNAAAVCDWHRRCNRVDSHFTDCPLNQAADAQFLAPTICLSTAVGSDAAIRASAVSNHTRLRSGLVEQSIIPGHRPTDSPTRLPDFRRKLMHVVRHPDSRDRYARSRRSSPAG